jgi:hypothetical protein
LACIVQIAPEEWSGEVPVGLLESQQCVDLPIPDLQAIGVLRVVHDVRAVVTLVGASNQAPGQREHYKRMFRDMVYAAISD